MSSVGVSKKAIGNDINAVHKSKDIAFGISPEVVVAIFVVSKKKILDAFELFKFHSLMPKVSSIKALCLFVKVEGEVFHAIFSISQSRQNLNIPYLCFLSE